MTGHRTEEDASARQRAAEVCTRISDAMRSVIDSGPSEQWHTEQWNDKWFDELAEQVWEFQRAHVPPYREWCAATGGSTWSGWRDAPMLPIAAFKRMRVTSLAPAEPAAAVWQSSGTTTGTTSEHHLPTLALYETSMMSPAQAMLAPEGTDAAGLAVVRLFGSAAELPHSSLAHMLEAIAEVLDIGAPGISGTYEQDGSLAIDAAIAALNDAVAAAQPVLILGPSFALAPLLDAVEQRDEPLRLPAGSRLMDTGGYKGRMREIKRAEILEMIASVLGIPVGMCENEYGMSELSTQAWLGTIRATVSDAAADGTTRWQPPWMRTLVVDPGTLAEVGDGDEGLLVHVDLANALTCSFVRTEDWGRRAGDSYELLGRAPGAELRGCSLRVEELLT